MARLNLYHKLLYALFICTIVLIETGCKNHPVDRTNYSHKKDSLQVINLLKKGDSLYARRSNMAGIAESMLYFDSANRVAQRLNDSTLLANTLFFIGNVYNAWNKEPQKTIEYYKQSYNLFKNLPAMQQRAFHVRYVLAHSYDGEKAADTAMCAITLKAALEDLKKVTNLPALMDTTKGSWNFVPDYAWVATNSGLFELAKAFLQITPRSKIYNDPESNNYLDHYYLTRARIEIFDEKKLQSLYIDSLIISLAKANNRFDSAYYSSNLSKLLERVGNNSASLQYSRLSESLNMQVGENDILSELRQELLGQQLLLANEKEVRLSGELSRRNIFFSAIGIIAILLIVLWEVWKKRRKAIRKQLRQEEFTRMLMQKEEDERRRIAVDLHDGINHDLLTLKNNLVLHKPVAAQDVEQVIASVREISRNLFPAMFENVGLAGSAESLCERFSLAGFFTTCDIQYKEGLSKIEELQVYRILQEALNNISRHAKAEAAKVTIKQQQGKFFMEVKDNGCGFDTNKLQNSSTVFGLQSMQQRAAAIKSSLNISSTTGGTTIQLTKILRY